MTYTMCARLIALGKMTADKLDVFYAAGRLTSEQYTELIGRLLPEG